VRLRDQIKAMIKLIAQPHNDTFQVFEMQAVANKKLATVHGRPGTFLGVITREEVLELFHEIQLRAVFDGEHEDLVRRFLRAKGNNRTLFQEAIESVK
jgi:hypothetical protein